MTIRAGGAAADEPGGSLSARREALATALRETAAELLEAHDRLLGSFPDANQPVMDFWRLGLEEVQEDIERVQLLLDDSESLFEDAAEAAGAEAREHGRQGEPQDDANTRRAFRQLVQAVTRAVRDLNAALRTLESFEQPILQSELFVRAANNLSELSRYCEALAVQVRGPGGLAREAKEIASEARDILGEPRTVTSSLVGRLREASPGHEELAQEPLDTRQPSWMADGPARLPSEMPPEEIEPTLGWQFGQFRDLPHEQQLTLYWALRLMDRAAEERIPHSVPGFRYLRTGFIEPSVKTGDTVTSPEFGVTVVAATLTQENAQEPEWLDPLEADGHRFPVLVQRPVEILHSPTIRPVAGSSGCWAYSRTGRNKRGPGMLTAKHVLREATSGRIPLTDGTLADILDTAPDGIDAALISTPETVGQRQLAVQQLVAPWAEVEFVGAMTGVYRTKIKSITDTRGILRSPFLPCRVFLGKHGAGGDSGALIRNVATGAAVGIYMGELLDPVGTSEGIAQHMYQAQLIMDLELLM
jgi:hypothetical protein